MQSAPLPVIFKQMTKQDPKRLIKKKKRTKLTQISHICISYTVQDLLTGSLEEVTGTGGLLWNQDENVNTQYQGNCRRKNVNHGTWHQNENNSSVFKIHLNSYRGTFTSPPPSLAEGSVRDLTKATLEKHSASSSSAQPQVFIFPLGFSWLHRRGLATWENFIK